MRRRHVGGGDDRRTFTGNLAQSTIIDKGDLPGNVQRLMAKRGSGRRFAKAAGVDFRMEAPTFYQPLFQATNMLLPRDRRERNEWCRHFYRTEPIVATALDIHTEFPISDINNMCSDPYIRDFFNYMAFEKLDLVSFLLDVGLEYWKIGDVFPYGQFNESEGMWERFTLLNPDFVKISSSIFAKEQQIELIPDQTISQIVMSGPTGPYGDIYRQFPEDMIAQIKLGRDVTLDNRLVTHIAHKASSYEAWGTPLMMRCFKTLIYKDKLRQAQDAIANRHILPIRVAKIGAPGEVMPSQDDIDSFRDTLLEADGDPAFWIVYHYGLAFDYVGSTGKILPLNTEFSFIDDELLTGLCISKEMLNGNVGAYGNSGGIGFDALVRRYMSYRLRLESFIRNKIYRPVSEVQRFYRPYAKRGIARKWMSSREMARSAAAKELELIVPKIVWQQQDLTSNQSVMSFIQQLQSKNLVSMTTVLPLLSLDPETERRNLESERGTVFDQNAPKTGPVPNSGYSLGGFESGQTVREVDDRETDNGVDVDEQVDVSFDAGPSLGNNPADFGLSTGEASVADHLFRRFGEEPDDGGVVRRRGEV